MASVCSASSLKRAMIFSAESAFPSGLADDADDLVERVEDRLEALEDVDALLERRQLVLEPPGDDVEPEVEEVPEDLLEIEPLGAADLAGSRSESGR